MSEDGRPKTEGGRRKLKAESQILKVSKKKKMPQRGNILVAPRFNAGYEKKQI